jgi:hypothetical protein
MDLEKIKNGRNFRELLKELKVFNARPHITSITK